nr:uncharacterized protein LOC109184675 [Ipomoea trifida]
MEYRAPRDIKFPEHATFDGTGDPREHLVSYQAKMQVLGVEEPLMSKAFLPTLKGLAQKWFLALPSRSIRCFNDLVDRFLTHYAVNIKTQRNLTHLSGVHQDEGEALKTYLARWQKEQPNHLLPSSDFSPFLRPSHSLATRHPASSTTTMELRRSSSMVVRLHAAVVEDGQWWCHEAAMGIPAAMASPSPPRSPFLSRPQAMNLLLLWCASGNHGSYGGGARQWHPHPLFSSSELWPSLFSPFVAAQRHWALVVTGDGAGGSAKPSRDLLSLPCSAFDERDGNSSFPYFISSDIAAAAMARWRDWSARRCSSVKAATPAPFPCSSSGGLPSPAWAAK